MSHKPVKSNPFPGLRPFTQEEDYLFFGREEQTLELLQRLGGNRFVAVVGTSGSGKSSLVRCGLLSELLGGRMLDAGAAWEIAVAHPGGNPLALLTDSLLEADLYDRDVEHVRENLLATLSRSHFGLVEAVKQANLGEGTNFLLVVDQFEEIFRFHEAGQRQQEVANEFVSLLLEAAGQKEVPIYVVLTMRSDFIGECGQFEGLAEMVNRGEFLIPRLNREQFKRVIEGPIKVAGGQIAPRLLQRLLNDLSQQADQLPCLQHALMRTWDVWSAKGDIEALDLDDYQRVGKMSQALSLHADEIYESLTSDRQRELCKGIFQALTVEESNNRGIRRPQRLGRLCQIHEVPADELRPIIDVYRQSGVTFLMPSPEVELSEQTIIDISHESLMRVWTRLRQWVEEETQAAGIYHRLSESADLHARGKAGLYRDPELGIALAWRESKRPNAAWAERYRPGFAVAMSFLEASQQASVAEEQAHEAARQHELEQAQQLAEAQQLRLEQQQRSARKLRMMMTGLAAVAVVAGVACIAALVANNQANTLRIVATQEAENARLNEKKAEQSALEANRLSEAAQLAERAMERTANQAEADRITAQRESYRSTVKLAESMLQGNEDARFGVAGILWQTQPELRSWEWGYLMAQCPLEEWSLQTDATGLSSAVGTVDGRFLVTAGIGGTVALWNLESRQQVWQQATGRVHELSVDRLGRFVGVSTADTTLPQFKVLDLATGNLVHQSDRTGLVECAFSAFGEDLYVLEQGTLRCISTSTWEQRAQTALKGLFANGHPNYNALFVDEAGKYVGIDNQLAGAGQSRFSFFDAQTLGSTTQLAGYNEVGNNLRNSSRPILNAALGELTYAFASSVYRKTIDENRQLLGDLSDYVLYLTVDPVSGNVLSATANGEVQIVDVDGGKHSILHGAPITGLATLPHGRFVTAGADGLVKCWTLTPTESLAAKTAAPVFSSASANFVDFTSDGKSLLYRTWDRHNSLYQLDSLSYRHFQYPDRGGYNNVFPMIGRQTNELLDYRNDSLLFFPQNSRGTDAESTRSIPVSRPFSAAFDDKGQILVVASEDGNPTVFDLESNKPVPAPNVKGNGPVAINRSGSRAAVQTRERLLVWEVATGRLLNSLEYEHNGDAAIPPDFHPEGELIAVLAHLQNPGLDRLVVWNSSLGKAQTTIESQPGVSFISCKFSADGNRLYALCSDDKVRILDWKLGKELIALTGGANLGSIAVSPDGLTLAYAGYNPNLFFAKSLPWGGETPRSSNFYRAVDDLRLYTVRSAQTINESIDLMVSKVVLPSRDPMTQAAAEELQGDIAHRQGRPADAIAHYTRAVSIRTSIVRDNPSEASSQGSLAIAYLKNLAVTPGDKSDDRTALLQQAISFWQTLTQNPKLNPVGWQHLLRFQLQLVDHQVAIGAADSRQHVVSLLSFWSKQSNEQPANRLFSYGLSEVSRKLSVVYPDGIDQPTLDSLMAEDPALAGVFGDVYADQRNWAQAVALYSRGIQQDALSPGLFAKRAMAYEQQQNWEAASADWLRAAPGNPEWSRRLVALVQRLTDSGEFALAESVRAKARVVFEEQLVKESENSSLAGELADLLLYDTGVWTLLKPTEVQSTGGATLTRLPDGSILASGKNPLGDAYTIAAETRLRQVHAIRLEALTHKSLPNEGPGRDDERDRGNFAMANFSVTAHFPEGESKRIEINHVIADYSNFGLSVNHWNIGGGVSRPHVAVYLPSQPLDCQDGARLEFQMHFSANTEWPGQNLGRFRLWVSTDPAAFDSEQQRIAALKLTDPWAKLAAAYYVLDDQSAVERLINQHPIAASGIGDLFAAKLNWERAISEYSKAITAGATDARTFAARAEAYEKLERWELAVADWGRVDELLTDKTRRFQNRFSIVRRADLYDRLRQLDKALADYTRAVELPNAGLDPFMWRKEHWAKRARWAEAIDDYRQVWNKREPSWYTEWYYSRERAILNLISGDSNGYRQAVAELLARTEKLTDADSSTWLVYTLIAGTDTISAETLARLTAAADRTDSHWKPRLKAAIHFRRGEFQQAADLFDQHSGHPGFEFLAAMAHLQLQHPDRARQLFQLASSWIQQQRDNDPGCGSGVPRNQWWGDWAIVLQLQREAARQIDGQPLTELDARLKTEPKDAVLRLQRARRLADLGLPEEALADLAQIASAEAASAEFLSVRGRVLASLNLADEALADLNRAIEAGSQDASVYSARGTLFLKRGESKQASADLEKSLKLEPTAPAATAMADLLLARAAKSMAWTVIKPGEMKSAGATLTLREDGSILASGDNSPGQEYHLKLETDLKTITALRLEALTDESLPKLGPGRGAGGNFSINWNLTGENRPGGTGPPPLQIKAAVADYAHSSIPITSSSWNIEGGHGRPHEAFLALETPEQNDTGSEIKLTIKGPTGGQWADQNLGRFRLSVSDNPAAFAYERNRFAALKLIDPWSKLGAAYALSDRPSDAAQLIARALPRLPNATARAGLIEQTIAHDGLLAALLEFLPNDPYLQFGYAKWLAARGRWDEAAVAYQHAARLDPSATPPWLQTGFWKAGLYPYGLEQAFPPEFNPDPLQPVAAVAVPGQAEPAAIQWQPIPPPGNNRIDFGTARGCNYALTRIFSPAEQEVAFKVGEDDRLRLFLNDRLIFQSSSNGGDSRPKENEIAATLQAGWNTVLVKVENNSGLCNAYLTLSRDPQDLVVARVGTRAYAAQQLAAAGKAEEAVALLTDLIAELPNECRLFVARAEAYAKLSQWDLALADWTSADLHAPDKSVKYGNPAFYCLEQRAHIFNRLKQYDKAVLEYTELLKPERYGNVTWALSGRAGAYDRLRQWELARADYDQVIKIAPTTERGTNYLARARHSATHGQWKQAADDVQQALQAPSDRTKDWAAWRDAALIFAIAGDATNYKKAAKELYAQQSVGNPSADQCRWTVLTMLLSPEMITNENRPRLLEMAAKSDNYWRPRLTAAASFRAGDYQPAADLYSANTGGTTSLFLRAMTEQQLGNNKNAKKLLEEGNAWIRSQQAKDPGAGVPQSTSWQDWISAVVLQSEASDSIFGPAAGPQKLALSGDTFRAVNAYAKALTEAPDQGARSRIVDELAQFDDVVTTLFQRLPKDPAIAEAYRRMVQRLAADYNQQLAVLDGKTGDNTAVRSKLVATILSRQDGVLESLLQLRPEDTQLATLHAVRIGDWKSAAAGYSKLTEQNPKADSVAWMIPITLWAYAGEPERHRELCQKMYERYRDSTVANEAGRYLKVLLLVKNEAELPQDMVKKFYDSAGTYGNWYRTIVAFVEFRKGNDAEAHKQIDEALAQVSKSPDPNIKAMAMAIRALTYARQQDVPQARKTLDELKQFMESDLKVKWHADGFIDSSTILNGVTLDHNKLAPEILRREAEKLIQSAADSPNPKTPAN